MILMILILSARIVVLSLMTDFRFNLLLEISSPLNIPDAVMWDDVSLQSADDPGLQHLHVLSSSRLETRYL